MPKLKLLFFVFFVLLTGFSIAQKKENRLSGIEEEIQNLLKVYKAVGLSVAVVENNQIIYSKGFGYRDLENKLPVTVNTIFPIGSITKSFTASLLGILETQNKVSIKQKPSFYIPKLQFYNEKMDNQITIGDLLCHRSGIGNADGTYVLFPTDKREDLMERLKYIKPNGAINDSWIYSNLGYIIAGTIVEKVSNQSWENNIQEKIFNPLHMNLSGTNNDAMFETNNFSFGYGLSQGKATKVLFEQLKNENPVGGINSTSNNLANYMMTWLNNGTFEQKEILSKQFVQEATSMKVIDNGFPPEETDPGVYTFGYGYGWKVNSLKGHYKVHHGGNISGFSSQMVLFPTDKVGIVILTNQNSSILPYIVCDIITNRMLGLPQTKWDKYPVKVTEINQFSRDIKGINNDKKPTHQLIDYCGKYHIPGYGTIEIVKQDDKLAVIYPRDTFQLEHQYYDIFVMKPSKEISQYMNPEFYLYFTLDYEGNISAVKINLQDDPVEFIKQTKD